MRIVLAYSGSSMARSRFPGSRSDTRAEIVTVTLDLGQGRALEEIRDRALALGALRAHVLDTREVFAARLHRAGAQGRRPARRACADGAGARRPLIAQQARRDRRHRAGRRRRAHGHATDGNASSTRSPARGARADDAGAAPARELDDGSADAHASHERNGLGAAPTGQRAVETNFWGRSLRPVGPQTAVPHRSWPGRPSCVPTNRRSSTSRSSAACRPRSTASSLPLLELVASLGDARRGARSGSHAQRPAALRGARRRAAACGARAS